MQYLIITWKLSPYKQKIVFGDLVYAQGGHWDLRLQCALHLFKSQNFKRERKCKLLGKSYLKPSYLRLRSSCYFTWEFACLAFTHNNSVGFCSKLGWTFSPDAWPLLHRWNSKSSPAKAIDILVLQKSWKLLWLEHMSGSILDLWSANKGLSLVAT